MKKTTLALALSALTLPAIALDKMPEPGFSGFIDLGVSTGSIESNFLARIPGIDVDLSDDTINELGSPDDESITLPGANYNLGYTFSGGKTRVFLGNDLADFLQFDSSTLFAVRHDFDTLGRFQLGFLSTAYPGVEVWEDPYLTDKKRSDTEFSSTGARITWDKIFGSQFELKVTTKERDLDNERSGESLDLSAAERKLLDREGDKHRAELGYLFNIDNGRHVIRPSVAYIDYDLDGDAMAQDGYELAVSYQYFTDNIRWVTSALYQSLDGDKENPIFNDVNDADTIAIGTQLYFPGAFGFEHWMPRVNAIWSENDSDIDFNDSKGWMIGAGMFRRF